MWSSYSHKEWWKLYHVSHAVTNISYTVYIFVSLFITVVCINDIRAVQYYLGNHQKETYAPTWMNHKRIVLSEGNWFKRLHPIRIHLYDILKGARVCRCRIDQWSPEVRDGESVWLWEVNMRNFFGVLEWFCILCVVVVIRIYAHVRAHRNEHWKSYCV